MNKSNTAAFINELFEKNKASDVTINNLRNTTRKSDCSRPKLIYVNLIVEMGQLGTFISLHSMNQMLLLLKRMELVILQMLTFRKFLQILSVICYHTKCKMNILMMLMVMKLQWMIVAKKLIEELETNCKSFGDAGCLASIEE